MKALSLEKMTTISGGGCGKAIGTAMGSIWLLASAATLTGVGAGLAIGLSVVYFGLSVYSATQCQL